MTRLLARRLGMPVDRVRRLGLFAALGVAMISAHALARTVAEAVFLANVGPEALPLYFVLVGIGSVPIAAGATRLIDRLPRTRLYAASQIGMALLVVGIRVLLGTGTPAAYYGALIGIVVIEMLMNIQFWVLVSDFFTSLEQKKIVPFLAIGSAAGGMLGGSLANVLSGLVAAPDVLLAFPFLYGLGFLVFAVVRRTQTALQVEAEPAGSERKGAAAEVWALVRGYPIVVLLAAVGFLEVMLGGLGSYLSYTVYSETFPTEGELTAFLGTLRAVLSVLQVCVIYFVTRPLVHRMGVGRMNLIYPSTTLASLSGLAFLPGLPTAVLAHVNFSTVAVGVAGPVENLTYNAVPPRFLGRVRTISEAMLQPTGLAAGGLLLALVQDRLGFRQIALLTLGVAALMAVLGWLRSRSYLRALQAQLRDRTLDLSGDDGHLAGLHGAYAEEVRELLESDDLDVRTIGLELAARVDPEGYLVAVLDTLDTLDERGRTAAIALMQRVRGRDAIARIAGAVSAGDAASRAAALEGLLAQDAVAGLDGIPALPTLLADPDPRVRGLAVTLACRADRLAEAAPVLRSLDAAGLEAAVRGAAANPGDAVMPVVMEALERGGPGSVEGALRVVGRLSEGQEARVHDHVLRLRHHDDEGVRAAAYALLARQAREMPRAGEGLRDPKASVRNAVARALADEGDRSLFQLGAALSSTRAVAKQAAIRALGRMGTARAAAMTFDALQRDYERAELSTEWLERLPPDAPDWEPLRIALEDSTRRAVETVLEVLGAFGHETTLRHARTALASRDERLRANAVETLASLPDRKFVLPVMDLLESLASRGGAEGRVGDPGARDAAPLEDLLEIEDRWVRAGAAATLNNLGRDAPPHALEGIPMSRLLFLKNVGLFNELSLDSLMALDQALRQADFLPGEAIVSEGSTGDDLYIVLQGEVVVEKGAEDAAREVARMGPGEFFGEMALFDDEPRSATVRAVTECTLLRLDRSRFHSVIEQLPRIGLEISRVLSLRLRRTTGSLQRSTVEAS